MVTLDDLNNFEGLKSIELLLNKRFLSDNDAEIFYKEYATVYGFSIRRNDSKRDKDNNVVMRTWVCHKEGFRRDKHIQKKDRIREAKPITRIGCLACFKVNYIKGYNHWQVTKIVAEHNHELVAPKHVCFIRSNREVSDADDSEIKKMLSCGIKPCQIMERLVKEAGGFERVGFTKKDLYNYIAVQKQTNIANGDANAAIGYLSANKEADIGFFYNYELNEGRLGRLFWSDSRSQIDYACFGDVIAFDSTYKANAYLMPLVIIVGVNNHHQTCVFGCAVLEDETIDSYTWLLQVFLRAMQNKQPTSIITDGDKSMRAAINAVCPHAYHRLCSWHLERNATAHVHDKEFLKEFKKCMFDIESITELEETWSDIIDRFELHNNQWATEVFQKRHMWANAYLRGNFWAEFQSTQRCEGMNSYIKGSSIVSRRYKLYELVQHFERAMSSIRNAELMADYESMHSTPVIQTMLRNFEAHAARIYTKESFKRVKDQIMKEAVLIVREKEIELGVTTYIVCPYDSTTKLTTVSFKHLDNSINCSCLYFETVGFPCFHAFHVAKVEQLSEIPQNLISPRWTKQAKILHNQVEMLTNSGSVMIPEEVRYGALVSASRIMCSWGCKSKQAYDELMEEIAQLTIKMKNLSHEDIPPTHTDNHERQVADPVVVRHKGKSRQDGKKPRKGKSRPDQKKPGKNQHCSKCKKAGHKRNQCPDDLPTVDDNNGNNNAPIKDNMVNQTSAEGGSLNFGSQTPYKEGSSSVIGQNISIDATQDESVSFT